MAPIRGLLKTQPGNSSEIASPSIYTLAWTGLSEADRAALQFCVFWLFNMHRTFFQRGSCLHFSGLLCALVTLTELACSVLIDSVQFAGV